MWDLFCLISFITLASLYWGTDVTEFDIMKILVEFTPYSLCITRYHTTSKVPCSIAFSSDLWSLDIHALSLHNAHIGGMS